MSGVSKHLIDHYLHELLSRINFGTFNEIEGLRDFFVKTSMYVFDLGIAKNGYNFSYATLWCDPYGFQSRYVTKVG